MMSATSANPNPSAAYAIRDSQSVRDFFIPLAPESQRVRGEGINHSNLICPSLTHTLTHLPTTHSPYCKTAR
jgi:hypothetical protein